MEGNPSYGSQGAQGSTAPQQFSTGSQQDSGKGVTPTIVGNGGGSQGGAGQPAQGSPQQQTQRPPFRPSRRKVNKLPIVILVIAVVAIVAAVGLTSMKPGTTTTTVLGTTTVRQSNFAQIASCQNVSVPGIYYLEGSIKTDIQDGPCINVNASNVSIMCNMNNIVGSGPYVISPPYTYGILVENESNVSIVGCGIKNFSFGVYSMGSSLLTVKSSNVSQNYMSNVWLQDSNNSSILSNYMGSAPSRYGSIYVNGSSTNNTVENNTVRLNTQAGITVNASGNSFLNNSVTSTPLSFYCSGRFGYKSDNIAHGNLCYNNTGCSFIQCNGINVQPDTRTVELGSVINSCGAIELPGNYVLDSNVDMQSFVNTSESTLPCINILSDNVSLDCMGHTISNATTGIDVSSSDSVSIRNCTVVDSLTGINIESSNLTNVTHTTLHNNQVSGIVVESSYGAYLGNVTSYNNEYGISLSNAQYSTAYGFSTHNNTFGIYLAGSSGNAFQNGVSSNNTKVDVYATNDSVSPTANAWQKSTCLSTDTDWAGNCKIKISPSLQYYPLQACGAVTRPGQYRLETNLVGITGSCFTVKSNGVSIDCNGHSIVNPSHTGSAISDAGYSNLLVQNCTIEGFATGIGATGPYISLVNNSVSGAYTDINLSYSSGSVLQNNVLSRPYYYGMYLRNVTGSAIQYNMVQIGLANTTGIMVANSSRNDIRNNSMKSSVIGMQFSGNSNMNTVAGNSGSGNVYDYFCDSQNSAINSEVNGINYGTTKHQCVWLTALFGPEKDVPCASGTKPTSYMLTSDYIYRYGATCFTVNANDTIIDCNGHTITATDGGTFAEFLDSGGKSKVENCNLVGFSTPIRAVGSSVSVINNTIYSNPSVSNSTAINVTDSSGMLVGNNRIVASQRGIYMSNSSRGSVQDNTVNASEYSFYFNASNNLNIDGNSAYNSSASIGMQLENSQHNTLKSNNLNGTTGLYCTGTSMQAGSNTDQGSNFCNSSNGCTSWISASSSLCHP